MGVANASIPVSLCVCIDQINSSSSGSKCNQSVASLGYSFLNVEVFLYGLFSFVFSQALFMYVLPESELGTG